MKRIAGWKSGLPLLAAQVITQILVLHAGQLGSWRLCWFESQFWVALYVLPMHGWMFSRYRNNGGWSPWQLLSNAILNAPQQ